MINRNLLAAFAGSLLMGSLGLAVATQAIASPNMNLIAQNPPQQQPDSSGKPHHRRPDFAAAAQKLGVSEAKLIEALGLPEKPPTDANGRPAGRPPRPDFAAAAKKLGVSEEQLIQALGIPPHHRPDFAAAAQKLGINEKDLISALGIPTDANGRPAGRPPKPDFDAAAQKLGVSKEQLIQALGVPHHAPRDRGEKRPTANQAPNS